MNEPLSTFFAGEPVTSDQILEYLRILTETKKIVPREEWLKMAFRLESLRYDPEVKLLNKMRREVALKRMEILGKQEKKNVALADAEIESLEIYQFARDQEEKIKTIDEIVRIAKKNSENY